ncbi:MAG TPA: putative zinc-binding protein [Geobacteraceae bacterium]
MSRIVYACSGCADVGEVADQVSRRLRKDGFATAKASCIVGLGAGITSFIEAAKAADRVITVDGCEIVCAKTLVENMGLEPQAIILTKMGLEKGKTTPSPELTFRLCRSIINEIN